MPSPPENLVVSAHGARRREAALGWLAEQPRDRPVVIVAPSLDAARSLLRDATLRHGALFGWYGTTLALLAGLVREGAEGGQPLATGLAREALAARAIHRASEDGALGRLAPLAGRPGFARALARTLDELGMAEVDDAALAQTGSPLLALRRAYREELAAASLADRADSYRHAADWLAAGGTSALAVVDAPMLLFDLAIATAREALLVAALIGRATRALATAAPSDEASIARLSSALGAPPTTKEPTSLDVEPPDGALARLQRYLFAATTETAEASREVTFIATPGENRECVEIARQALQEAEAGIGFDRMAVILRAPELYADHLAEAFERAAIPAHFAHGTLRPDPAGRALLALLHCAAEGASAGRFAEYLSLGMVPKPGGEVALALPQDDALAWLDREPAEDEDEAEDDRQAVATPRRWERLLVDAAVIGGRDRWARRLRGLASEVAMELEELALDDPRRATLERRAEALVELEAFALPLVDRLCALPERATWGRWIEELALLTQVAVARPTRVLQLLAELAPMAPVGPVSIDEVLFVLRRRLAELSHRPTTSAAGRVFVGSPEEARGLDFDLVFVPGLAEKIFPKKVTEDPLALDEMRRGLSPDLATNPERVAAERRALALAVGAARRRVVLSYPRVDLDRSRPRVPSFYGLEVLRAAEGLLPSFETLARRADAGAAERMGWPAPADPAQAIDASEYDLAVLERLLKRSAEESRGAAQYLLTANDHLARSLRFRARRWMPGRYTRADGLRLPEEAAREALALHRLAKRPYSPTALERFARCPYQFFLGSILRLSPRDEAQALEELGPLERGRLIHEIQMRLMRRLAHAGSLPVTPARIDEAVAALAEVVDAVAADYEERLAPAIGRVWHDGVEEIRQDLTEWLWRQTDEREFRPVAFELAFGLPDLRDRDASSTREPAAIRGATLRGSIDLVEESPRGRRATDYKTGRAPEAPQVVIGGGKMLQPLLYALALEALDPARPVVGGRLYYCTARGGYEERVVDLDDRGRELVRRTLTMIDEAITKSFLVAYPEKGACDYCDYQRICGPHELLRIRKKPALKQLDHLRDLP